MSVYLGIGDAAHTMSKLYVGIDGKARQVRKMYAGVNGQARLAYQSGTPLGGFAVGSTVKIAVGGKSYDWLAVHQGLPGNMYDASCSGTWLLMKDIYENRQWNDSGADANDYEGSTIHSYLNSTFLSLLESNIKNAIKRVKIPYRKGSGASPTVTSGSNGLSAKIFLLSATETSFNFSFMPSGEGAELAYFKGCADNRSDPKRVAYLSGFAANWWLRSPYCHFLFQTAIYVDSNGKGDNSDHCNLSYGVRPCMILPQDTLVDETGRVIA